MRAIASTATGGLEVSLSFQPKTYDIDFAGIVSNIVYIRWLEDLRLKLLDAVAPLNDSLAQGHGPVLLETQIVYKKPVRIQDQVAGRIRLARVTRIRWEVQADFRVDDAVVCTARQWGVYIALKTGRPVRLPAGLLAESIQ